VVVLYIYEPEWFDSYEFDSSHLEFVNQSLKELIPLFAQHFLTFITRFGSAPDVLKSLHQEFAFTKLYSHQETGNDWTFQRDLKVKSLLKSMGVSWREWSQFAIARGLKERNEWNQLRVKLIERELHPSPRALPNTPKLKSLGISSCDFFHLPKNTKTIMPGGQSHAKKTLESFLGFRSKNYLAHISDPHFSQESSSRLSPYISFGCISLTQIHHRLLTEKKNKTDLWWLKSLEAFESRLWWHCHFMQKLETEPELEFKNANRAFDGLRESEFNQAYFEAWCKGETGYPLIDACMRSLLQTGWLNFRMRAMLVSFASYQLWLDWRVTSRFLAKHFLDFEAGIHFSQFQMQSGVTGINSIRIYSPLKQSDDQKGALPFVRKYLPELESLPDEFVLNPTSMPQMLQMMNGFMPGQHYPEPIVDPVESYHKARERIFQWRSMPEVRRLAQGVLKKHASQNQHSRGHFPRQKRS